MDLSTAQGIYLGATGVQSVYLGSTLIWPATQHDYSQDPLTFEVLEAGQFKFKYSSANTSQLVMYSLDNGTHWTMMSDDTWTATIPAGSTMIFDCYEPPTNANGIGTFSSTGNFNVSGNIGSLLEGHMGFAGELFTFTTYQFRSLFKDCTHLISAEHLWLPTLSLREGCYREMFSGCTSLTKAPSILPATTLASYCYLSMFEGCISLIAAPELPATSLGNSCYYRMFYNCTSLMTAPVLPAPRISTQGYYEMFRGCSSLNSVTCLATDISAGNPYEWLYNVSATGTFTKAASMNDWTTGTSGIPSGWTIVNAS